MPRPAAPPVPPALLLAVLAAGPAAAQDPPAASPPAAPPVSDRVLSAPLAPSVSPKALAEELRWLTAFDTRHTLSAQNVEVANALRGKFREMGYEDVELEEFAVGNTTRFNVVAVKPGTGAAGGLVVVGAHYDCRNNDLKDARGRAPGADDNGTGTVAVLAVARALADVPTARTVRFVLFSGEEQGLVGAKADAAKLKAAGTDVALMVNMDMVGRSSPPGPDGDAPEPTFPPVTAAPDAAGEPRAIYVESDEGHAVPTNDAASQKWGDRLEAIVYRYGLGVSRGKLYATDYMPFEAAGYPAVGLYDGSDTEPFYHNAADTPAVVDADYHARAASAALDLVRDAAGAAPAARR